MTYQQEMAKIEADTRRIRAAGEELKEALTYNPDIHAATQPVHDPAPDGIVDWRRIGEMLDSKWS